MFKWLYNLLGIWLGYKIIDELIIQPQAQLPQSQSQPPQPVAKPKRTLDEMPDGELMYGSRVSKIIRWCYDVDSTWLISEGFKKLSKVLTTNSHYGWPEITVESLKLVAFEMQCNLQKALDTYEIFVVFSKSNPAHNHLEILIRPRDRDFDKLKDEKKEKIPEPEVVKVRAKAAGVR